MSTTTWKIDSAHSEIQFKVKHMMISTVTGGFAEFDASLSHENEDLSNAKISFSAQIASITTGNEARDGHLISADFFNAEKYPEINFVSTSFQKTEGNNFKLEGNLTLKSVTKLVILDVEYNGIQKDMYGQTKAGFELSGAIKRKDFNLNWDSVTETGNLILSDEVKLIASVQFIKTT